MRISRVVGSLVAAAAIACAVTGPAGATDFTTYAFDSNRDGWNSNETILTPANVPGVQMIVDTPIGGANDVADAQPLYLSSESTPLGVTNVVYVATENNTVLAWSPRLNQQVWKRTDFGPSISNQSTGCPGETDPSLGITGTPVIDTSTDTMYFVTDTYENGNSTFRLRAISPGNGADKIVAGGTIIPVAYPLTRKQRPALTLANGNVYIAFGGSGCDYYQNQSYGEVFAYSASTLQSVASSYRPASLTDANCHGSFLDSIWMSGNGPAADPYGNIWFATGNGCLDYPYSLGMALIRLSPTLTYPNGSAYYDSQINNHNITENTQDLDTGSGGVVIGTNGLVVYGGKDGQTWIIDDTPGRILGGYCYNPCLYPTDYGWQKTNGGLWGSPAIFTAPSGATYLAIGGQGAPGSPGATGMTIWQYMGAYRNGNDLGLVASANDQLPNGGAVPVVSSNGTASGTYVVWFLKRVGSGQVYLYGYNAENMALLTTQLGGYWNRNNRQAILAPAVADGYVMVASDNRLRVWTVAGNYSGVRPASRRHK